MVNFARAVFATPLPHWELGQGEYLGGCRPQTPPLLVGSPLASFLLRPLRIYASDFGAVRAQSTRFGIVFSIPGCGTVHEGEGAHRQPSHPWARNSEGLH
jgi:hypothetical protein